MTYPAAIWLRVSSAAASSGARWAGPVQQAGRQGTQLLLVVVMLVTVNSMAARAPARACTRRSPNRSAGAFRPSPVQMYLRRQCPHLGIVCAFQRGADSAVSLLAPR